MKKNEFTVTESVYKNKVKHDGKQIDIPENFMFVKRGDAALTRRLKAKTECWILVHRRRNRIEALGLYADKAVVETVTAKLAAERESPEYRKKLQHSRKYRAAKEQQYKKEFRAEVISFLAFPDKHAALAAQIADAVTNHAVPVGSGTVARTRRIPLARRAEAAVIAWMRHKTSAYDFMTIARVKGERREVRRKIARKSHELLAGYRAGLEFSGDKCLLSQALQKS